MSFRINLARTIVRFPMIGLVTLGCSNASVTVPENGRVDVSAPVKVLVRGASTTLAAAVWDVNGQRVSNPLIVWETHDPLIASVTSTGTVTAIAPGRASIVARAGKAMGSVTIDVTEIPVPEPDLGDVVLFQENFDALTDFGGYATRGVLSLVPGRTGVGMAVRFSYSPTSDDNLIERAFPASSDIYFRYWYRITPAGAVPYSGRTGSGIKWFMLWRAIAARYTCGVGLLTGGPAGYENSGWEFNCHDNTSVNEPVPFNQNIDKTKKFGTTNDGNWHKYTLHLVTGNGGYEQIWIDGVLVLESSSYRYDNSSEGISLIQLPGLIVDGVPDSSWSFAIDVDDLAVWHE